MSAPNRLLSLSFSRLFRFLILSFGLVAGLAGCGILWQIPRSMLDDRIYFPKNVVRDAKVIPAWSRNAEERSVLVNESTDWKGEHALFLLRIQRIDVTQMTWSGTLEVSIPDSMKYRIKTLTKEQPDIFLPIWQRQKDGFTTCSDPEMPQKEILVALRETEYYRPLQMISAPYSQLQFRKREGKEEEVKRWNEINKHSVDFRYAVTCTLQNGKPSSFPSDWYWISVALSNYLPSSDVYNEGGSYAIYIPFKLKVRNELGATRLRMVMSSPEKGLASEAFCNIVVETEQSTSLSAYLAALSPLVLVLVLIHLLFVREERQFSIQTALLDAVAVIVAVLPIRQIFVPTDFPVNTRLDCILMFCVLLTVCLVCIRYSIDRDGHELHQERHAL